MSYNLTMDVLLNSSVTGQNQNGSAFDYSLNEAFANSFDSNVSKMIPSKEDVNYSCHELHQDYDHYLINTHFWIEGIALLVIGTFGIIGNNLTIIVLIRMRQGSTFNRLLLLLGKSSGRLARQNT